MSHDEKDTRPGPNRRHAALGLAAGAAALAAPSVLRAQSGPVRIGYTMARTGPWTPGAQTSQEPNYLMWAAQQNAAGGLNVKGTKRQIELVSSDDRSDIETCVRSYEKLMGSDKVDLVLAPWGSGANFAVAPLANRYGYPFLAPTALSRRLVEMKLPYFFLMLQQPKAMCDALVALLAANGVKTVAVIYTDDLFGLENYAAFKVALQGTGITMVEDKSFSTNTKDLSAEQGDRLQPALLLPERGHRVPVLPRHLDAGRRGRRDGHGLVEPQDQRRRQSLLRRARGQPEEGTRPLGQRRGLGQPGDPDQRGRQGRAGPQGDPRLHRQYRAQHHPRKDQVQRQRERRHARHGVAMAERRVRGDLAQVRGHRGAEPEQAGLEIARHPPRPPDGLRAAARGPCFCPYP